VTQSDAFTLRTGAGYMWLLGDPKQGAGAIRVSGMFSYRHVEVRKSPERREELGMMLQFGFTGVF